MRYEELTHRNETERNGRNVSKFELVDQYVQSKSGRDVDKFALHYYRAAVEPYSA